MRPTNPLDRFDLLMERQDASDIHGIRLEVSERKCSEFKIGSMSFPGTGHDFIVVQISKPIIGELPVPRDQPEPGQRPKAPGIQPEPKKVAEFMIGDIGEAKAVFCGINAGLKFANASWPLIASTVARDWQNHGGETAWALVEPKAYQAWHTTRSLVKKFEEERDTNEPERCSV